MAVERILHCDNRPDCPTHERTATPPPYMPVGWLLVTATAGGRTIVRQFCSWECTIRYGAKREPPTLVEP